MGVFDTSRFFILLDENMLIKQSHILFGSYPLRIIKHIETCEIICNVLSCCTYDVSNGFHHRCIGVQK